jgi:hypothetical protein
MYGNVALNSERCPRCKTHAFVIDEKFSCCGLPCDKKPKRWKRMSACKTDRIQFSLAQRTELVNRQNKICFWCKVEFDKDEYRHGKLVNKTIHIEHIEPFIYSFDNSPDNFVASCSICNSLKSCLMFQTIHECREYIKTQRALKGFTTKRPNLHLSPLRDCFP